MRLIRINGPNSPIKTRYKDNPVGHTPRPSYRVILIGFQRRRPQAGEKIFLGVFSVRHWMDRWIDRCPTTQIHINNILYVLCMNQDKINEQERSRISDIHKQFYKTDIDTDPDHDSDSDKSYESTHDSNIIFANLNKPLYDLFAPSPLSQPKTYATQHASVINTWIPPAKSGLSNCQSIIPNYYARRYNTILDIDYLTIIKDDIKIREPTVPPSPLPSLKTSQKIFFAGLRPASLTHPKITL